MEIKNKGAEVQISVPAKADSGDKIDIVITYKNLNRARLTDLNLNVFFPEDFIYLSSSPILPYNADKNYWRLPSLEGDGSGKLIITGQIVGSKGEEKDVEAVFFYKPTNFHSTFKEVVKNSFIIEQSVLDVRITGDDTFLQEQEVGLKVFIKNTGAAPIANIEARLTFPSDVSIISTSFPLSDGIWKINELKGGEESVLEVRGNILAQAPQLEEFKAEVGVVNGSVFLMQNRAIMVASVLNPEARFETRLLNEGGVGLFGELEG